MPISISFGDKKDPTVIKKSRDLYQFNDGYQANRFYTVLKGRIGANKWTMIDVDRLLMEMYGDLFESGSFRPTWRDWSHYVKPGDVILRTYSDKYATLYFKGVDEKSPEKEATVKDFKNALKASVTQTIESFMKDHPEFDSSSIDNIFCMIKVQDLKAKNVIVCTEVKDE